MNKKISLLVTAGLLPFCLPAQADDVTYETIASAAEKSTDLSGAGHHIRRCGRQPVQFHERQCHRQYICHIQRDSVRAGSVLVRLHWYPQGYQRGSGRTFSGRIRNYQHPAGVSGHCAHGQRLVTLAAHFPLGRLSDGRGGSKPDSHDCR